jgi:hypothetical protein
LAASTIALTYTELRRWIAREIGADRGLSFSSITTTDVADILKRALHRYYWPKLADGSTHVWSWLKPKLAKLQLHGPYTTGTVSITNGVVTGSGTTFPTWAAQGDLFVGGYWSTVASRASGTSITLDDTSITGVSAATYSLVHREYDLEDDFGGLVEPFTYRSDQTHWTPIETVNEAMIRSLDQYPTVRDFPRLVAIVTGAPTSTSNSKQQAIFDPPPDDDYELTYRYAVIPPMLDGSSYVYAHGGAQYMDALIASCVDMALQTLYGDQSKHGDYQLSIKAAIELDLRLNRPATLGFGSYSSGYSGADTWSLNDIRRQSAFATIPNLT